MKISNRNYPILEKLYKGSLGMMPICEKDKSFFDLNREPFINNWKFNIKNFQQEINVVSESFYQASNKAEEKLLQLYRDIVINNTTDFDVKGCYLMGDYVHMINYEAKGGSETGELVHYTFTKDGFPVFYCYDSEKYNIHGNTWVSLGVEFVDKTISIEKRVRSLIAKIIVLKMFKSYAEVETVYVKANSKKVSDKKYVNDTNQNITFLDSTWFTNLVRSEEFKVSGHFRLQVCGEGRKDKKLIWISDFVKTGYTRKAQILN